MFEQVIEIENLGVCYYLTVIFHLLFYVLIYFID